jgi:hypothetical protein
VNLEVGDPSNSKAESKEVLRHHIGCANLLGFCGHSPLTLRWLESNLANAQTLQWRFLVLVLYFLDITGRNFGQVRDVEFFVLISLNIWLYLHLKCFVGSKSDYRLNIFEIY